MSSQKTINTLKKLKELGATRVVFNQSGALECVEFPPELCSAEPPVSHGVDLPGLDPRTWNDFIQSLEQNEASE